MEAEAWSTRPAGIVRQLRLVRNALHTRDKGGDTPLGPVAQLDDGCLWVRAFPGNGIDCMLVKNTTVDVHIQRDVMRILWKRGGQSSTSILRKTAWYEC